MSELESLTKREKEILKLYALGLIGRQIAEKLGISERTVETHREGVMRKLGVNLWAACAQAGKAGWI